jgi:hypothetical protein
MEQDERAALERAAYADDRTMSGLARKLLTDWLRANGYLQRKDGGGLKHERNTEHRARR